MAQGHCSSAIFNHCSARGSARFRADFSFCPAEPDGLGAAAG
jgi:hypothetical protein